MINLNDNSSTTFSLNLQMTLVGPLLFDLEMDDLIIEQFVAMAQDQATYRKDN